MVSINIFRIFSGVKVHSGRPIVLRMRSTNLIYLSDENRNCSSFVGTKIGSIFRI